MFKAKDGTDVTPERWGYVITYLDGTKYHQFDKKNKKYNNFAGVKTDKVSNITMVNLESGESHSVDLPQGSRVIHYYDNIISAPMGGSVTHHRLYCFGYELNGNDKIYTILPDDTLIDGTA
jgi:hypothetical protein